MTHICLHIILTASLQKCWNQTNSPCAFKERIRHSWPLGQVYALKLSHSSAIHHLLSFLLQGGPWFPMPVDGVHDPRLQRSVRSYDLALKGSRSNLVSHVRSFYHLRPSYGILFLPKFHQLDQWQASVQRLNTSSFGCYFVNMLLNVFCFVLFCFCFFVSSVKKRIRNTT